MNIEIANRLVNLRKSNGLSQEALAEKLGISRQAVSKWERAEASPDTDNIIMLARLYGVSLDELLRTEDEIPVPEPEQAQEEKEEGDGSGMRVAVPDEAGNRKDGNENPLDPQDIKDIKDIQDIQDIQDKKEQESQEDQAPEYVHVGLGGVHVRDKDGSEVHVGWDGIHVDDRKMEDEVHIDKNGVYVNGERYDKEWLANHGNFPLTVIITALYLAMGFIFDAWHPAWLLFFLVPLWHSFVEAVRKENAHLFAYPVLAALLFLCMGIFMGAWHPGWVIFLTVPVYYPLVSYFAGKGDED